MVRRIRAKAAVFPGRYPLDELPRLGSLYDFDDRITAPLAGFRDAEHYYSTQSSRRYLADITVPTLIIQAEDDPLIPAEVFAAPALSANPNIQFHLTRHGGHLGFLARGQRRFWLDHTVVAWIGNLGKGTSAVSVE
jgi:predicted alpha/beta-fold hydrolase